MAVLDREREVIVIRVVYDGPPEAGKTTSLRALASTLLQRLHSPAEEYGRTLYFDWLDYTAGRFEGCQVRCQIVSVPGQRELAHRRLHLLKTADVVVFVGDSMRSRVQESLDSLRELTGVVSGSVGPPVGVIYQANKRDLPDAMPMDELRTLIRSQGANLGVVESIASDGTGIREAFVFAVRLALDRVREQLHTQSLGSGRPEVDSSHALLAELQTRETAVVREPPLQASSLLRQVLSENDDDLLTATPWNDLSVPVCDEERPRSPDPSAPSGSIWPPVEGRLTLQDAASTRLTTHRLRSGAWTAGVGQGWRIFSNAECVYDDPEAGRETLVRVASLHSACKPLLSANRCIVLAATGHGTWRLWQIVRAERPLREQLSRLEGCTTEEAALRIIDAASQLYEVSVRMKSGPCHLPCSVDTIGSGDHGPVYVGLMPMEPLAHVTVDPMAGIGSQLGLLVRHSLPERGGEVLSAISRGLNRDQAPYGRRILDELAAVLEEEPTCLHASNR